MEIARALAASPQFMLLDEPFAGIDPIAIGDIRLLVRQLTARGIGVLVTDHNVRETLELIDRALIIHEGKVLTEGTPDEIVSNPDVRRYYLGDDVHPVEPGWRAMALTQRLEMRQGQSLVMTPQLQQAIKLLQMSNLELQAFVETELERNPLLERDERARSRPPQRAARKRRQPADVASASSDEGMRPSKLEGLDTGLENVYADESRADADNRMAAPGPRIPAGRRCGRRRRVADGDGLDFDATLTRGKTLAEHLDRPDCHVPLHDPADRLIGQHLIGMVNEAGYLTSDVASVAEMLGTGARSMWSACSTILQSFDPAGVFARDLERMPGAPAQGPRPLRSGHGGTDR